MEPTVTTEFLNSVPQQPATSIMSIVVTRNPNLQVHSQLELVSERTIQNAEVNASLFGTRPDWWWTGKHPSKCVGFDRSTNTLSSLPMPNLNTCTRQAALEYFDNTWALSEILFSALQGEEAFYRPPYHALRHPLVFYYCHPASLYVNKFRVAGLLKEPVNEYYEQLFETGVDEMSWDDLSKNEMPWPPLNEINAYRRTVYTTVRKIIENSPEFNNLPITQNSPAWALFLAFEHERIHIETTSVLMRELPVQFLRRPEYLPPYHASALENLSRIIGSPAASDGPVEGKDYPANQLVFVQGKTVQLGKPADFPAYGWDNEYGSKDIAVGSFKASKFKVTNGEFWHFVKSGAYQEAKYWSTEGWKWRCYRNAKWPTFWALDGPSGMHKYKLRVLFDLIDMPWNWPVIVNYHEAKAFCQWKSEQDQRSSAYRVITEAEHVLLRDSAHVEGGVERDTVLVAGGRDMLAKGMNKQLALSSESPVDSLRATDKGFHDVFGNVWEWCEDHFCALPGFKIHPYYDDFSTPCFDGHHQMMMGGAFISTGNEASIFARYAFRPHFFQMTGFRLVIAVDSASSYETTCMDCPPPHVGPNACCTKNPSDELTQKNMYETQKILNEYLALHYGPAEEVFPYAFGPREAMDFPARCAQVVMEFADKIGTGTGRALDVGCAVGRSVFELTRKYNEVIGIDLSKAFIDTANSLKEAGQLEYQCRTEGVLSKGLTASVDGAIDRSKAHFRQGDACCLPADLGQFDAVMLANLLCRLPAPKSCLGRMFGPRGLVKPGGLLVTMSPFTWMEDFTPQTAWLGGYEKDGEALRSADGLKSFLSADFELIHEGHLPLLIREHARKYQYIVSHLAVFRRKC
eukprot:GILK01006521.1.p1 GENE.GILK01006521.1~~GILK01006521.1.p1  ORF type:complete len:875 (-),score=98.97 GILK01006521.1:247-2820(-)